MKFLKYGRKQQWPSFLLTWTHGVIVLFWEAVCSCVCFLPNPFTSYFTSLSPPLGYPYSDNSPLTGCFDDFFPSFPKWDPLSLSPPPCKIYNAYPLKVFPAISGRWWIGQEGVNTRPPYGGVLRGGENKKKKTCQQHGGMFFWIEWCLGFGEGLCKERNWRRSSSP